MKIIDIPLMALAALALWALVNIAPANAAPITGIFNMTRDGDPIPLYSGAISIEQSLIVGPSAAASNTDIGVNLWSDNTGPLKLINTSFGGAYFTIDSGFLSFVTVNSFAWLGATRFLFDTAGGWTSQPGDSGTYWIAQGVTAVPAPGGAWILAAGLWIALMYAFYRTTTTRGKR